jgi:hypothetical protein
MYSRTEWFVFLKKKKKKERKEKEKKKKSKCIPPDLRAIKRNGMLVHTTN